MLSELAERFSEGTRGEVTIVVAGAEGEQEADAPSPAALDEAIRERLAAGEPSKQIAAALAGPGRPRRDVYARAVELRRANE